MVKRILFVVGTLLLAAYVGSYAILSRAGYANANRYGFKGFYYFTPEDSDGWRLRNGFCFVVYWPLNRLDAAVGLGRLPASEPLWGIE